MKMRSFYDKIKSLICLWKSEKERKKKSEKKQHWPAGHMCDIFLALSPEKKKKKTPNKPNQTMSVFFLQ